eukprot:11204534-Lingulodinium_polyedra.AAC.1
MNAPLDATITRSPQVVSEVLGMSSTPDAGPLARRVPRVYNESILSTGLSVGESSVPVGASGPSVQRWVEQGTPQAWSKSAAKRQRHREQRKQFGTD